MVVLRCLFWIYNTILAKALLCLVAVLSAGPLPHHIAFIMDGSRRYARKNKSQEDQYGHKAGFRAFRKILGMCLHLNISCVSVYAFSLENFKRSAEEIDTLMTYGAETFPALYCKGGVLDKYGVRLNVIGRRDLLPEKMQRAVQKAEKMTQHNNKVILNIYGPYTSRDEITTAIESCVKDELSREDIDPDEHFTTQEIDKRLTLAARGSPPLDILVRTSGVKRLSDFLLWQCCEETQIQFSQKLWPEFGIWDLIIIILDYQRKVFGKVAV